jgi:murein tripeptide amidase MpaA
VLNVSSAFDSGNIEVEDTLDPSDLRLRIRVDHQSAFYQWFHFRLSGARGIACRFRLVNAAGAAYPAAWPGTRPCVSVDRVNWTRVDARYEEGELRWDHTPTHDVVWYAYFAPYSLERHQELLGRCQLDPRVRSRRLGATLDGRDLDLLTVGTGRRQIWVIARQHPGESMAEWWMEGFLARLLHADDALARALLRDATFHVVPNMNPDGSFRGHLRTNAVGSNLNREWHAPTLERSPEVKLVRDAMDATGVDLCLDVHGDEELPYNFIAGPDAIPSFTPKIAAQLDAFRSSYMRANPDFQREHGYAVDAPGQANLTMCTNQVAERFKCLAMTLEMPFKDTADHPMPEEGWSPRRSMRLGASVLDPIAAVMEKGA